MCPDHRVELPRVLVHVVVPAAQRVTRQPEGACSTSPHLYHSLMSSLLVAFSHDCRVCEQILNTRRESARCGRKQARRAAPPSERLSLPLQRSPGAPCHDDVRSRCAEKAQRRLACAHLKTKLLNLFRLLWLLSTLPNGVSCYWYATSRACAAARARSYSLCGLNGNPGHLSPSLNDVSGGVSSALLPYITGLVCLSLSSYSTPPGMRKAQYSAGFTCEAQREPTAKASRRATADKPQAPTGSTAET